MIVVPTRFHFRWIPFIAATIIAVCGCLLGRWQTHRAEQKEEIASLMTSRSSNPPLAIDASLARSELSNIEYRHVTVKGQFVDDWPIYLENRPYKGAAGFYQLMPFKIANSNTYVVVERGWLPRSLANRTALPSVAVPLGQIAIDGVARHRPGRLLQIGQLPAIKPGSILQNIDVEQFREATGFNMLPFVIEQHSDNNDGLIRKWPPASAGSDRNRGYAFQWYALAALAILFFIVTGLKRESN